MGRGNGRVLDGPIAAGITPFSCSPPAMVSSSRNEPAGSLDLKGERIAFGAVGHSDCVLDPANGLFYASAKSGLVAARRLSDGGDAFSVLAQFGEMWRTYSRGAGSA